MSSQIPNRKCAGGNTIYRLFTLVPLLIHFCIFYHD